MLSTLGRPRGTVRSGIATTSRNVCENNPCPSTRRARVLAYSFHGLRKNADCYLAELGLSEDEIGIICALTPATVRHYPKRKNNLMIAQGIALRVARGDVLPLKWEQMQRCTK